MKIEDIKYNYTFVKHNKTDKIWWLYTYEYLGKFYFTFDKKEVFDLFGDYPDKLTPEQKKIFDAEN